MQFNDQISSHEVRIYSVLKDTHQWLTNREIAQRAKVARRTASHHTSRLVDLGIIEVVAAFPGYRFRITGHGNKAYLTQLDAAAKVYAQQENR